jgi:hypothetical protein
MQPAASEHNYQLVAEAERNPPSLGELIGSNIR